MHGGDVFVDLIFGNKTLLKENSPNCLFIFAAFMRFGRHFA